MSGLRVLLAQPRSPEEMGSAGHEVRCVCQRCDFDADDLEVWNPIDEPGKISANDIGRFDGVIIGASSAGTLSDPESIPEGLHQLRPVLDEVLASEVPFFGLCFGHEVMAWHLGSPIRPLPGGSSIGTFRVDLTDMGHDSEIFKGLPRTFLAQEAHTYCVAEAPSGSVILAVADRDPYHALCFGPTAWGVQFHPDVGRSEMIERLKLAQDVRHTYSMIREEEIEETPEAGRVLANFGRLVRQYMA